MPIPQLRTYLYKLGTTALAVTETSYDQSPPIQLLLLHHNEVTAKEVAEMLSKEMGINNLQLTNNGRRLVDFNAYGKNYRFDPNRMFSTAGIVASLQLHSQYTEAGFQTVSLFRDSFLSLIHTTKTIVSMHNNSDGDFALTDYLKNETGLVHQNPLQDPDDFFITTDSLLFNKLKEKDLNVVLEYGDELKDDGSLSIYCSRNKIMYVNVEAEHGHKNQQEKMLRVLIEIFK